MIRYMMGYFSHYRREILIFAGVFCATALLQGLAVWHFRVFDMTMWSHETELISKGITPDVHGISPDYPDPIYLYPATALLLPASTLSRLGLTPAGAFKTTLVTYIALGVAAVALAAYRARKKTIWWVGTAAALVGSELYIEASPPSAAILPYAVLMVLLTLLYSERIQGGRGLSAPSLLGMGILGGVSMAIRIDVGAFIFASSLLYMSFFLRWRTLLIAATGAIIFLLLDPYLLFAPFQYVGRTLTEVHGIYTTGWLGLHSLPITYTLYQKPFAILSFALGALLLVFKRSLLPFSTSYFLWLALMSILMAAALARSLYHPEWYFFPLVALWEVFFPLFAITLIDALPPTLRMNKKILIVGMILPIVLVQLLAVSVSLSTGAIYY